ncbi:hypothetical protein niasHT_026912 [Heterodera trifolii]|uniref:Uncharacterized protein n=1 Tax=Heterodera trifolii TaxID=157864 RepID=A0ABD2JYL6_9BILA
MKRLAGYEKGTVLKKSKRRRSCGGHGNDNNEFAMVWICIRCCYFSSLGRKLTQSVIGSPVGFELITFIGSREDQIKSGRIPTEEDLETILWTRPVFS